ncbi:MAG: hypothetical protein JWO53_253, partial [Chlamydiia bacterium]|nr:hypothetical protein [Chlamydiia bacterium]
MLLPKLQLNLQVGDCCTGSNCCSSKSSAKAVSFTGTDGKEDAEAPSDLKLILDFVSNGTEKIWQARPLKTGEGLLKRGELYQTSLSNFYDECLVKSYGIELIAIVSAWQNIDFVSLYKNAVSLTASHVKVMNDALTDIGSVNKEFFDFVIEQVKAVSDKPAKEKSIARTVSPKLRDEQEESASDFDPLPDFSKTDLKSIESVEVEISEDEKEEHREEKTEMVKSKRLSDVSIDDKIHLAFMDAAKARPVLLDFRSLQSIAMKLSTLRSQENGQPKTLAELSSRTQIHSALTQDEASKLISFVNCIADVWKKTKQINVTNANKAISEQVRRTDKEDLETEVKRAYWAVLVKMV